MNISKLACGLAVTISCAHADESCEFADPALADAFRSALELGADEPIPDDALRDLEELVAVESGIGELDGIECATGLQRVYLNHNAITDLRPVSELPILTIGLLNNEISDLSPMTGHPTLEVLQASENQIGSVAALRDMPMLRSLYLADNPIETFEGGLSGLPGLRILQIDRTQIGDLSPLSQVPTLTSLDASELGLSSLASLPSLPALTSLYVNGNAITEVAVLADPNFPSLTELGLDANPLESLDSILALSTLRILSISAVGIGDLTPLATLGEPLDQLTARDNGITDLGPVADVPALDLGGNAIADLTPLVGAVGVGMLRLDDNAITDASPLLEVEFESCAIVNLNGNPIADLQSITSDLCARSVIVEDVCLPNECSDPCAGAGDCG